MRSIKPNARRRSFLRAAMLAILAISIGGAGTIAALAGFKIIDPAKLAFWTTKKSSYPRDWLCVPMSLRVIPAYTVVTREYLADPKTLDVKAQWYSPEKARELKLKELEMSKILGRVTKREKPAGYFFHESDFLPVGSSPGVPGGTPIGKRAMTLEASKIKGCVFDLKEGDHVDLLASVSVDMPGAGQNHSGQESLIASPDAMLLPKRGFVKPLVQDGFVVSPVKTRLVPILNNSVMNGATTKNVQMQEFVLAVTPEEVAPLLEAINLKYEILCVARSGQAEPSASPGTSVAAPQIAAKTVQAVGNAKAQPPRKFAAKDDVTPGLNPMDGFTRTEVIHGTKRQYVIFKDAGSSPVVAAEDDMSAKPEASARAAATEAPITSVGGAKSKE